MNFTIKKKIFLGTLPLYIVICVVTALALFRLDEVYTIFNSVVDIDIQQKNSAEKQVELLRDRESKVIRYLILQSDDMLLLLEQREKEYDEYITHLSTISDKELYQKLMHENVLYNEALAMTKQLMDSSETPRYQQADSLRTHSYIEQGKLLQQIKETAEQTQKERTENAVELISLTFRKITTVALTGLLLAIIISAVIIESILRSVRKLKQAALLVSQGEFNNLPMVKNSDEIGELSRSFNYMAHRLIELEEAYKDASPLTRLPGGIAVESVTQHRIDENIPFAFCMLDLDNFKPFNDRYGYSRGNQIIKHTAEIIQSVTQQFGHKGDFVGHIGGDDFVIITTPSSYDKICNEVIARFDRAIESFYDADDCSTGHILSRNRRGEEQEFPIMTVSISAVHTDSTELISYIQVGEIIAELKKYAKGFTGSNLVVDRRIEES